MDFIEELEQCLDGIDLEILDNKKLIKINEELIGSESIIKINNFELKESEIKNKEVLVK